MTPVRRMLVAGGYLISILAVGLVAFVLVGIYRGIVPPDPVYTPVGATVTHRHSNGLAIELPEQVEFHLDRQPLESGQHREPVLVDRTADGFMVGLARYVRWRTEVAVRLGTGHVPSGRQYQERTVRGVTIRYALDEAGEAGSCGTMSTFTAFEQCGDKLVTYEQQLSYECGGGVNFAWLVVEGTRCEGGRGE